MDGAPPLWVASASPLAFHSGSDGFIDGHHHGPSPGSASISTSHVLAST